MRLTNLTVALVAVGLSISVLAAEPKSKKEKSTEIVPKEESFTVSVEQSTMHIDTSDVVYKPIVADWEFSASNWTTNQLSRPSLIPSDSNFQTGNIPLVGISRINAFATAYKGILESVIGLEYAQFVRQGTVSSTGSSNSAQENLNVAALKFGAAYRFTGLASRSFQPSLEAALLPTWISSENSAFEQYGVNAFGVIFQTDVKLMYCPQFMQNTFYGQSNTGEGFGVAYLMTAGSVGGSDLTGGGFQGILRMAF